jgi:hypothetical protein
MALKGPDVPVPMTIPNSRARMSALYRPASAAGANLHDGVTEFGDDLVDLPGRLRLT